jgi:hypothetical protein
MRIDPVYVVAPLPAPKAASRRGFLALASSFAAGALIGGACGYSMGASNAPAAGSSAAPTADADPPSSGDVELDDLRWLAVKAPIAKLVEKNALFIVRLYRDYPNDPFLWKGIDRLCRTVLAGEQPKDQLLIAKQLVPLIEHNHPPADLQLEQYLPALRAIK